MLTKKSDEIKSSEITDEKLFLNRRAFIRGAALVTTATASGLIYRRLATPNQQPPKTEVALADPGGGYHTPSGEKATGFEDITNYNNFYEFSTNKEGVAPRAQNFVTRPWTRSEERRVRKEWRSRGRGDARNKKRETGVGYDTWT